VELNPEIAIDVKKERLLADFLASNELRPSPDRPSRFPYRLVPIAAQLAVAGMSPGASSSQSCSGARWSSSPRSRGPRCSEALLG